MALHIENPEIEQLADEVARLAGETQTEAVRQALLERLNRLVAGSSSERRDRVMTLLEADIWPLVPAEALARPVTTEEEAALLGFGPDGV
jgi:antitoxin VapB